MQFDVNHVLNLSTYLVQIKVVAAPISLNLLHLYGIFVSVTLDIAYAANIYYVSCESQRIIEARYSHDYLKSGKYKVSTFCAY